MRTALVFGAGGFIGDHMVSRLKEENFNVIGVDIKLPEYSTSAADEFIIGDLRNTEFVNAILEKAQFQEVYQFAADMGGAGYIFSGENDAQVMHNSVSINLNLLYGLIREQKSHSPRVFFSSSACVYPQDIQLDTNAVDLKEALAYPANPDSEYGWEKLFSERLFFAFSRNYGIDVRVARFHNVYGPKGTWSGGKEKAPAAICRKVASANEGELIEIWGDGLQTRSFLYISDCIEAVRRFMKQENFSGPINIGSEEMVSINDLAQKVIKLSGKNLGIKYINGPTGVRGRNSNNEIIRKVLNWNYSVSLEQGLEATYPWILKQIEAH